MRDGERGGGKERKDTPRQARKRGLTNTRGRLAIPLILHIAGGKHALHTGVACPRPRNHIPLPIHLHLPLEHRRRGLMPHRIEQPTRVEHLLLPTPDIPDPQPRHQAPCPFLPHHLRGHSMVPHTHLRMAQQALRHRLARPQRPAPHQHRHPAPVLGQEQRLLRGAVPAAHHHQRLPPEDRHRPIAHRARAHPVLPVPVLALQAQPLRARARRDDDRVGRDRLLGVLGPGLERPLREIHALDGFADDGGAEALALSPRTLHQLRPGDARGEAQVVLDVRGGGELPAGGDAVGEEAFVHEGGEVGAGGVDGGAVGGGAGADDEEAGVGWHFGGGGGGEGGGEGWLRVVKGDGGCGEGEGEGGAEGEAEAAEGGREQGAGWGWYGGWTGGGLVSWSYAGSVERVVRCINTVGRYSGR